MVRPVKPRDAASLILLRSGGAEVEVLMGRRAHGHRFLPDVYVFPGGRVDAADYVAPLHTSLRKDVHTRVAFSGGAARARALGVTALRETWEETGLALGKVRNGCLLPELHRLDYLARAITPPASPMRFHARFFVTEACGYEGELGGSGELLDLGWRPIAECLRMPIADVTEFVLAKISSYVDRDERLDSRDVPLFCYRNGVARVRG